MTTPPGSADTLHRAEDFLNAFNEIDRELRRRTRTDEGFRVAARAFLAAHPWWRRDFEAMNAFADLRNVIVHDRVERFAYLSIPTAEVVAEIQAIRDRLLEPRTAFEAFRREVEAVDAADSLASLLARVRGRHHTQFPVYENGTFLGLVTGNGVTHWLATELERTDLTLLDFQERRVRELLEREEARPNWVFVARSTPAEEVVFAFAENPQLEAALVTHHGEAGEALLGIATQWDVAAWRRDPPRP